jgi:hypothetical protein
LGLGWKGVGDAAIKGRRVRAMMGFIVTVGGDGLAWRSLKGVLAYRDIYLPSP